MKSNYVSTNILFVFTVSINPQTYLSYLLNTFISLGGTTQRVNLTHINECIKIETDVVINCSGIHARTLAGVEDSNVYAARGQIVVVQLPQHINWAFFKHGAANKESEITYAIPRDNGEIILGGTYASVILYLKLAKVFSKIS